MPSSSSYNLEVSLCGFSLAFDVALLNILRNVGIEVMNTNIKAVKPTMAEGFGEGLMRDNETRRGCGSGEDKFGLDQITFLYKDSISSMCYDKCIRLVQVRLNGL